MRRVSVAVRSMYETFVGYSHDSAKRLMKQYTLHVQCPSLCGKLPKGLDLLLPWILHPSIYADSIPSLLFLG